MRSKESTRRLQRLVAAGKARILRRRRRRYPHRSPQPRTPTGHASTAPTARTTTLSTYPRLERPPSGESQAHQVGPKSRAPASRGPPPAHEPAGGHPQRGSDRRPRSRCDEQEHGTPVLPALCLRRCVGCDQVPAHLQDDMERNQLSCATTGELVDRDVNAAQNLRDWPDIASCGSVGATAPKPSSPTGSGGGLGSDAGPSGTGGGSVRPSQSRKAAPGGARTEPENRGRTPRRGAA